MLDNRLIFGLFVFVLHWNGLGLACVVQPEAITLVVVKDVAIWLCLPIADNLGAALVLFGG